MLLSAPAPASAARRPPAWVETLQVRGQNYVVELLPPAEKSSGGIWLADRFQENWTHGIVRAAGPGEMCPTSWIDRVVLNEIRTTMFAKPGDEVIFQKHHYHSAGPPHTYGTVRDEDLVAVVVGEGMNPLNDWVMIRQDPDIHDASSAIAYAEEWRPKPCSGIVLDFGPGKLQWRGQWWGVRMPVPMMMGLVDFATYVYGVEYEAKFDGDEAPMTGTELRDKCLLGKRVHWGRDHEMLSIGREHLEALMIEAGELLLLEEN